MAKKYINWKTKGMNRDMSVSAFNPEFAFENVNLRLATNEGNTTMSWVNEKGTRKMILHIDVSTWFQNAGFNSTISGIPVGTAVINHKLVIFSTDDDVNSYIYVLEKSKNEEYDLEGKLLYWGNLGFNTKYPLETLVSYESENIQKVYWTDDINQPRMINIAGIIQTGNDSQFDFIPKLHLNESIQVTKLLGSGEFSPGVIQYAFTYYNKYGQESNIFYTTPLYYISYNDRGASPEGKVSNSFEIKITNVDKNFDYIRVYSIHRTSLNTIPEVRRVVDIAPSTTKIKYTFVSYEINLPANKITMYKKGIGAEKTLDQYEPSNSEPNYKSWTFDTDEYFGINLDGDYLTWNTGTTFIITITNGNKASMQLTNNGNMTGTLSTAKANYIDNGLSGDTIDPTELLYIGGEEVIFGTMDQKDNTLFLGDIKLKRKNIDDTIRSYFKGNKNIAFSTNIKNLESPEAKGYYPYTNQLKLNSYQFKTFKYFEYYRFGIQAQHYTGKWSEPIWINDVRNTTHIDTTFYDNKSIGLPVATFTLSDSSIIKKMLDDGYVRIRPVVVYPTINDREVICQGILCPTVYNVSDRYGNSPFAQSSWFIRPNIPFDIGSSLSTDYQYANGRRGDWRPLSNLNIKDEIDLYSRAGILYNGANTSEERDTDIANNIDVVNKGVRLEFRHNRPIPSNEQRNAEIQCIYNPPDSPFVDNKTNDNNVTALNWVNNNGENYYVDQSILTFHSPDIEFDTEVRSLDTSNLQLRIVGMVPITSFVGDIDIQTSTPVNNFKGSDETPRGFYKEPIGIENSFSYTENDGKLCFVEDSHFGYRSLAAGVFWLDEITGLKPNNSKKASTGFIVYPWHRNGSLNNTKFAKDGYRSAMLDKKKLSNMRYSYKSYYFAPIDIWNAYESGSNTNTGISGVSIFDSDEISLVKLPAPENSDLSELNYYGNIDKLLTITRVGDKKDGYPIITTGVATVLDNENELADESTSIHRTFSHNVWKKLFSPFTDQREGVDPVRIKYKSTPHAVLALNYTKEGAQRILPTIRDGVSAINNSSITNKSQHFFWSKETNSISQDVIDSPLGPVPDVPTFQYGWLWLGELYNPNVTNRFGGQTKDAFENNQWVPCGKPVSLIDDSNRVKDNVIIKWEEGDTYFQRYDHIKTYPFTLEDQNAVTDIISFMCETHVNLDGRYDRNRGQLSNFAITPANFNLINDVYNQQDNFFNYRILDEDTYKDTSFPNTITWTKTKENGADVDLWTNITLANTLEMDGDKGKVNKICRLNNQLLSFQDSGIAQILYNENTQISTTEGVPIEIANSQKVQGKRYLSDTVGCSNKWSMTQTPRGIYFMDSNEKSIYLFNGQLNNLSTAGGFNSWAKQNIPSVDTSWSPEDFGNFVTYYDKLNQDVLFINMNTALAYSEKFNCFTSFYDYGMAPYFEYLDDMGIWLKNGELWQHQAGDYCDFFNENKPFSMTLIGNQEPLMDKTFTNLEFRACVENEGLYDESTDKFTPTLPFDTLEVWNEYQHGILNLHNRVKGEGFTHGNDNGILSRKFRMWRCDIPRDNAAVDTLVEAFMGIKRFKVRPLDRIRNPWVYIKLTKNSASDDSSLNKTEIHDIMATYFG